MQVCGKILPHFTKHSGASVAVVLWYALRSLPNLSLKASCSSVVQHELPILDIICIAKRQLQSLDASCSH
jgi:hypothetical protein